MLSIFRRSRDRWSSIFLLTAISIVTVSAGPFSFAEDLPLSDFEPASAPFSLAGIPGLDKWLKPDFAGQMNGMDQLVVAHGQFDSTNIGNVLSILKTQGFRSVPEFDFVGGSGMDWAPPKGKIRQVFNLERTVPQTDQLKLYILGFGPNNRIHTAS